MAACINLGKKDERINGARVYANGNAGCWCERGDRFFIPYSFSRGQIFAQNLSRGESLLNLACEISHFQRDFLLRRTRFLISRDKE